ncbi:bifunctional diguanylate cyclase/phosphodiesterase [Pseudomonas matsuisoli]|uniref:PAS domain S-box-containing protein/diguanylate cyclase (GGDEF) domain-containing protein n=1 Tax=Pseudomonas matsuisoli TaxID=1515666 RepID=A0A917Q3I1_9PSED|nr:diguanylate cyclase [Pseudomonas matsuisoli]GGK10738.1 hypothetical protein GCM10009304_40960 [Pseudomonas matsuisoli]
MLIASEPENERSRLTLLQNLAILDTPPEEAFDRITRVVSQVLSVPIALVSLVDENRQWFKSRVGLEAQQTPRDMAFCAHALHVADVLVIEDALRDPRFHDNPLVTGPPNVRFYAGVPLRTEDGLTLGTLCAIDTKPRVLADGERAALMDLARVVERELLNRRVNAHSRVVWEEERQARVRSDARFGAIFHETPTGKVIVGLEGRFIEVNPKFCEITGFTADELKTKTFREITHPDDLHDDLVLMAELQSGVRRSFSMEKRYIRKSGESIWVQISVSLLHDESGAPDHFIGVVLDITDRKKSERVLLEYQEQLERSVEERTQELVRSQGTLQTIADNLPILIAQVDSELRYRFNNRVYLEVFGIEPAALYGQPVTATLGPELLDELLPFFQRALAGERVTKDAVQYRSNEERIWSATYIPDIRDGEVAGFFVMSNDVTEQKRIERTLYDKAMLDPLTDLPNRRALQDRLERSLQRVRQDPTPFVVLFMDLDGFKAINDVHGHDIGDELLRHVARRLSQSVRKGDFVCRLAGDEFIVVADSVPTEDIARRIADDITAAIAEPFALPVGALTVGVSVGIAFGCENDLTSEAILARADGAMYEAKRRRRNAYRLADG